MGVRSVSDVKKYLFIIIAAFFLVSATACGEEPGLATTGASGEEAANHGTGEAGDGASTEEGSAGSSVKLDFSATDLNGEPMKLADAGEVKLIMVNFWEPWCGPCVREMPELEKLYQDYKDKGFLLLGVFFSLDSMEDARAIVDESGVTYPILMGNEDFMPFTTEYVPTTVFFDSEGNLLSGEALVGARSYEEWEQEILQYLDVEEDGGNR